MTDRKRPAGSASRHDSTSGYSSTPRYSPTSRRGFLGAFGVGTAGGFGIDLTRLPGTVRGVSGKTQDRGEWESGPEMPDQRTEVGAAVLDGRLFVVGGFVPGDDRATVTDRVVVFDPGDSSWEYADPIPEPRHHAPAVSLDSDLYVVGGLRGGDFEPVDSVWRYDGSEWEARAALPTPHGALAVGEIDGKIYAAGGQNADGSVAALSAYDPGADEWTELTPMPTARNHLAGGAVGGRFYAVGGRTGSAGLLGATEAYDPETDEWTELTPMPTPRGGIGGTTLNGRVVAVGGEGPNGTFVEVEAYDPETGEWEQLPPLPTARHGLGVAAINGTLYVAAGGPTPGLTFSGALEIFRPSESEPTTGDA